MIDRRSAHVSVERETIAEDGVVRREQLRDEYARHEEGADGAVGGAVVGAGVGAVVAGPIGAAVGILVGAAAGEAAGAADQEHDRRDAADVADDFTR